MCVCGLLVQPVLNHNSQLMPTPPKLERLRLLSDREDTNQMVSTLAYCGMQSVCVQWAMGKLAAEGKIANSHN